MINRATLAILAASILPISTEAGTRCVRSSRVAVPVASVVGATTIVQQPPITQNFFVPASGGGYGGGFGYQERQQLGVRLSEQLELERQRLQRRTNELMQAQINIQQQLVPQQQLGQQFDASTFQQMCAALFASMSQQQRIVPQQAPQQAPQQPRQQPTYSQQAPAEPRQRINLQCEVMPEPQRRDPVGNLGADNYGRECGSDASSSALPTFSRQAGNRSVVQTICARCHGGARQAGGIRFDRDIPAELALRARVAIANGSMPPREAGPLSDPDKFLAMIEFLSIEQKRDLFRSLSERR